MARQIYKIRKTISMKRLISELGGNFSKHIKKRLLDLEIRCVLTRDKDNNRLDIKHVEHIKNNNDEETVYGQFFINEENLYFSQNCLKKDSIMESPIIKEIYDSLDSEEIIVSDIKSKKLDDTNIDYVIDSILKVCPDISEKYKSIVKGMLYRANK
ncbi:hypothetical protein Z959_02015 [Clostridium novyi B str. ATCC 27606]|uniref:Uncharacterized protein n=2 Tax=Clostridium TaxID=1485 RepID=A0AA40ISV6_CLONO|nr:MULTISPECIES: hypothetical protein [Clostridium]KEI14230.1 hypothetical protein Z959_02015 [Clostridium novyi B str. ATCC 27606]KEI14592.1 hypothetical protein Z958_11735 [Clostridium novyi B str. NCTC 9691]KEI16027.1 hypothetical protein Z960_10835 [Clostridium haemolyticum NCTC 9693]KGN03634.1 hypothetical protein Z961_07120 [Clostridium haemolyticum NCTC 8350]OOB76143.1 hypothetical protein AXF41_04665 [Clostridium haemolyticum]